MILRINNIVLTADVVINNTSVDHSRLLDLSRPEQGSVIADLTFTRAHVDKLK